MSQNPLPESVTQAQTDDALRALGIPERIGLTSLEITPHKVIVTRWVKDDDRRILGDGPARVEIPINRGRTPDELTLADDPTEPFSDGA